jgi:hypothetical protein
VARSPFGSRPTAGDPVASPVERIVARALAAQARETTENRRLARRTGAAARDAAARTAVQNDNALALALDAVRRFDPATLDLLAAELDAEDPLTQHSGLGRAAAVDAGLPGWLRDRCLAPDAERVVRDWLEFRAIFAAHREFSARPNEDPLPQVYEALSLSSAESIAVEGVDAAGREVCERILHVALSLRAAQRAVLAREVRTVSGYAAADLLRAFDRSNRFLTAGLAEWIAADGPDDARVAAEIVAGEFSVDELDEQGRSVGIAPFEVDPAALVAELGRTRAQ